MHAALHAFRLDPSGLICADFGCSTGGFTDCLLRHGAARVFSVDTGYGVLAWSLRNDPRVTVLERTNCLHALRPSAAAEGVDLVVIDASWTPQKLVLPAAKRWLNPAGGSRIISLLKPHYENKALAQQSRGVLSDEQGLAVAQQTLEAIAGDSNLGLEVLAWHPSPTRGLAGKSEAKGNLEYLVLLALK
ncbi:MAG: hypothetical protein IBJ18_04340 [Phycisphaerales bacterium]|nr:hypothetical protein [Phycisphaerales bacterium]